MSILSRQITMDDYRPKNSIYHFMFDLKRRELENDIELLNGKTDEEIKKKGNALIDMCINQGDNKT